MIDFGFEVFGDLDNLDFSFGLIILNVLGNFIIKVVIVLFIFLVSLVGSEDEFNWVDFVVG